jgi:ferredoxin-type protein NapG
MAKTVKTDRRKFMKYSTIGILALVGGAGVALSPKGVVAEDKLRPPGAVEENEFLALCIKCGQCLQVCPYHSIKLSDLSKGYGEGTPYIDANIRGCYACEAVPCVLACPSGALDHKTEKPEDIKMGIAILENPRSCLAIKKQPVPKGYDDKMKEFVSNVVNTNEYEQKMLEKYEQFEGKECTLCADMCPIPNPLSAIAMVPHKDGGRYPEIYDGCIGCGVCQEVCPVQSGPAIIVKPRATYDEIYKS